MSLMKTSQAMQIADSGDVVAQIRARLAAGSTTDATYAKLMIEIAQLALAEASRVTDDSTTLQASLDEAAEVLNGR
jgi:hypothetical protein